MTFGIDNEVIVPELAPSRTRLDESEVDFALGKLSQDFQ